ncbi:amidohydrolase [Actinomadura barringtoniae]|uniref:Amidohydrolase n=1 Tax=Actinomadura barringtoniae TaxID=1427535 RepID=A0A939P8C7_9ACTN|nr:amidohydrolase family protein [Actinomadura barringtoniae]MBO2447650.1 amidohydrolase [Actinomadura barringtoniae]
MPSRVLSYPLFDADNHLYETEEALTRHLPKQYAGAIQYVQVKGRTKIAIRGQISEYIPNPTFEVVARPGSMEEYFRNGNPEGKSRREIFGEPMRSIPAFREPGPRMELMDELGIQRTLMFPTLASLIEERMRDDPELIHVVTHSLNQWLHEEWSFNYKDRIYTTPVISLPIVDKAIAELDWCLERGAKAVLIRPAPVPGFRGPRSFALPEFDPFWKRIQDEGVVVGMHSSDSGYSRYANEWEGSSREMLPFQTNTFRMVHEWRPVTDAVASMVCHGLLSRFPELRMTVIENGSSWMAPLLTMLADVHKKAPEGFGEDPVEAVKRNVHVSPFWEEDMSELAELIGVDRVLFGSDYPHPEGLADPVSYVDALGTMTDADKAKIMGGNLARLMAV